MDLQEVNVRHQKETTERNSSQGSFFKCENFLSFCRMIQLGHILSMHAPA